MELKDLLKILCKKFAKTKDGIHGFGAGKQPNSIRVFRSKRVPNDLRRKIRTAATPFRVDFGTDKESMMID